MRTVIISALLLLASFTAAARPAYVERQKLNFNAEWRLQVGDFPEAAKTDFDDSQWRQVTLPYAFNGDEDAFGGIVEVAEPAAGELDLFKAKNGGDTKNELRIVEIEFLEDITSQTTSSI